MAPDQPETSKNDGLQGFDARYERLKAFEENFKKLRLSKTRRTVQNVWLSLLRIVTLLAAMALGVLFIYFLFSDYYVLRITDPSSGDVKVLLFNTNRYISLGCLGLGLLFFWVSTLTMSVKKKNRTISKMATMMSGMMEKELNLMDEEKKSAAGISHAPTGNYDSDPVGYLD